MRAPRVSIHAHQFHSGRPRDISTAPGETTCFNPRPPISQRATAYAAIWSRSPQVFQSTPTNFTAGDLGCVRLPADSVLFQSTPTNFTAGDQAACRHRGVTRAVSIHAHQFHSGRPTPPPAPSSRPTRFNPRPPISQRATSQAGRLGVGLRVSIHAHQFHSGRQAHGGCASGRPRVSIHARQFHSGRRGGG